MRVRLERALVAKGVHVQVDEAGHHVEASHGHGLACLLRRDAGGHGGDLALGQGHVERGVDPIRRIDHVSPSEQQIVDDPGVTHGQPPSDRSALQPRHDIAVPGDLARERTGIEHGMVEEGAQGARLGVVAEQDEAVDSLVGPAAPCLLSRNAAAGRAGRQRKPRGDPAGPLRAVAAGGPGAWQPPVKTQWKRSCLETRRGGRAARQGDRAHCTLPKLIGQQSARGFSAAARGPAL